MENWDNIIELMNKLNRLAGLPEITPANSTSGANANDAMSSDERASNANHAGDTSAAGETTTRADKPSLAQILQAHQAPPSNAMSLDEQVNQILQSVQREVDRQANPEAWPHRVRWENWMRQAQSIRNQTKHLASAISNQKSAKDKERSGDAEDSRPLSDAWACWAIRASAHWLASQTDLGPELWEGAPDGAEQHMPQAWDRWQDQAQAWLRQEAAALHQAVAQSDESGEPGCATQACVNMLHMVAHLMNASCAHNPSEATQAQRLRIGIACGVVMEEEVRTRAWALAYLPERTQAIAVPKLREMFLTHEPELTALVHAWSTAQACWAQTWLRERALGKGAKAVDPESQASPPTQPRQPHGERGKQGLPQAWWEWAKARAPTSFWNQAVWCMTDDRSIADIRELMVWAGLQANQGPTRPQESVQTKTDQKALAGEQEGLPEDMPAVLISVGQEIGRIQCHAKPTGHHGPLNTSMVDSDKPTISTPRWGSRSASSLAQPQSVLQARMSYYQSPYWPSIQQGLKQDGHWGRQAHDHRDGYLETGRVLMRAWEITQQLSASSLSLRAWEDLLKTANQQVLAKVQSWLGSVAQDDARGLGERVSDACVAVGDWPTLIKRHQGKQGHLMAASAKARALRDGPWTPWDKHQAPESSHQNPEARWTWVANGARQVREAADEFEVQAISQTLTYLRSKHQQAIEAYKEAMRHEVRPLRLRTKCCDQPRRTNG